MNSKLTVVLILVFLIIFFAFKENKFSILDDKEYIQKLRSDYSSGDYTKWEKPHIDSIAAIDFQDIGKLPKVSFPKDNPYSDEKRNLGELLFFDPRLSSTKQIACASCHDPEIGWGDGRRVSYGHNRQQGTRNAMTILNTAYNKTLFWDGRANSLEEQVIFPINDSLEMHSNMEIAIKNIQQIKGYKELFSKAFGDNKITKQHIQMAIATFERTIVSRSRNKFDEFIGGRSDVYTDEEVLGLHLFRTKARCINCHNTPLFSDQKFHNDGLTYYKRQFEDLGLYNITQRKEDVGKFKTPSLREINNTAPYMHNGLFPLLSGIINMYNAGMPKQRTSKVETNDSLAPKTSPLLKELNLTKEEKKALEVFLKTLSSRYYKPFKVNLPE